VGGRASSAPLSGSRSRRPTAPAAGPRCWRSKWSSWGDEPGSAERAGRHWASALAREGLIGTSADADGALEQAAELNAELGVDVATEPLGDRLYLTDCPHAKQVDSSPGICEVHWAPLRRVLAGTGEHAVVVEMLVGVRPGLCVALLRRNSASPFPRSSDD
jgi:hypothetical protein